MSYAQNTLGYHRAMCVALAGKDNRAVEFLDEKIAESPDGPHEEVIAAESQMVALLLPMLTQPRHEIGDSR